MLMDGLAREKGGGNVYTTQSISTLSKLRRKGRERTGRVGKGGKEEGEEEGKEEGKEEGREEGREVGWF